MASELSDFELLLADSSNSHQSLSRQARQGCCLITIVVWHILQSALVKGGGNLRSLPTNFLHGCLGLSESLAPIRGHAWSRSQEPRRVFDLMSALG